ncbi:MAG: MlaA family lipoprotein, partial [Burkholderiales bacterium]
LKPVAKGYVKVVPEIARIGVSNFFRNIGMIVTTFNDALQLKGTKVPVDIMRFSANLVFGLGGLIDIASELQIAYHDEDFGQTLGYWGIGSGPYLVLPLLGPSTVRDGVALPVDLFVSPLYDGIEERAGRWSLIGLSIINRRANLLDAEKFLEQASIDRYAFLRDTYFQRRDYLIRDGDTMTPSEQPEKQRPKSLLELDQEEFGDEPILQRNNGSTPGVKR